jgi:hypothetical protein
MTHKLTLQVQLELVVEACAKVIKIFPTTHIQEVYVTPSFRHEKKLLRLKITKFQPSHTLWNRKVLGKAIWKSFSTQSQALDIC